MARIEGASYSVDIEWDKEGKPVLYIVGRGRVTVAKQALVHWGANKTEKG